MGPADERLQALLDKWTASLQAHLRYAQLSEADYWKVQAWVPHERPNRWIIELAMTRLQELKRVLAGRRAAGDDAFATALELMGFLTNLVGSQHIARFIPLADPSAGPAAPAGVISLLDAPAPAPAAVEPTREMRRPPAGGDDGATREMPRPALPIEETSTREMPRPPVTADDAPRREMPGPAAKAATRPASPPVSGAPSGAPAAAVAPERAAPPPARPRPERSPKAAPPAAEPRAARPTKASAPVEDSRAAEPPPPPTGRVAPPAAKGKPSPERASRPGPEARPATGPDEDAPPLDEEAVAVVVADAIRLRKWGREWHELATVIGRMAGRPALPEIRRILRTHKAEIETGAPQRRGPPSG